MNSRSGVTRPGELKKQVPRGQNNGVIAVSASLYTQAVQIASDIERAENQPSSCVYEAEKSGSDLECDVMS